MIILQVITGCILIYSLIFAIIILFILPIIKVLRNIFHHFKFRKISPPLTAEEFNKICKS